MLVNAFNPSKKINPSNLIRQYVNKNKIIVFLKLLSIKKSDTTMAYHILHAYLLS